MWIVGVEPFAKDSKNRPSGSGSRETHYEDHVEQLLTTRRLTVNHHGLDDDPGDRIPEEETIMRKLVVSEFITLDGVIQAPGASDEDLDGDFEHGGWQRQYMEQVAGAAGAERMAASDAMLLGRKTYEYFAGFWPTADVPGISDHMNGVAKYVVSTTLRDLSWQNSTLLTGDLADEVNHLKSRPGKDIMVVGSGNLARSLIQRGLVDEYFLMVHPILVGGGKRLFDGADGLTKLQLIDSKTTPTGVLILTYQPDDSHVPA